MRGSGMALMGCGTGSGPDRINQAVKEAFESPLLNDYDLKTAKNVLVNITAGKNEQGLKMNQLDEINKKIAEYTGGGNNFKHGLIWDEDPSIGDTIHITAIATGFKLGAILGPDIDLGSIIAIDSDYVYDKSSGAKGEAQDVVDNRRVGFSTTVKPKFDFNPEVVPALITENEQAIRDLEEKAAIRRIQQ